MPPPAPTRAHARGERFTAVMAAAARRLPFGLARLVPPTVLGFCLISLGTFSADLLLLTGLHGGLRWPVPAAITVSYLAASGLSYLLNRALNFRSHGALGSQAGVYAVVIAVNYLALILGVGAGLAALGLNYQVARVLAGLCEAVYMYCAMRWLVFRDTAPPLPRPPVP
jgi:putative flippase GtrA